MSSSVVHTVKSGETLSGIASIYDNIFTLQDLLNWNPTYQSHPNSINPGDELLLFADDYYSYIREETFGLMAPMGIQHLDEYNFITSDSYVKSQGLPQGFLQGPSDLKLFTSPGKPLKTIYNWEPKTDAFKPEKKPSPIKTSPYPNWFIWGAKGHFFLAFFLMPASFGNNSVPDQPIKAAEIFVESNGIPQVRPYPTNPKSVEIMYVTYTKYQPDPIPDVDPSLKQSRVYVGRSRGFNKTPQQIVKLRDYGHQELNGNGYQQACLDEWALGTLPVEARHSDPSYMFIRGREQLVMENLGDCFSYRYKNYSYPLSLPEYTRSGNKISGIDRRAAFYSYYTKCKGLAMIYSNYIPTIDWEGACH